MNVSYLSEAIISAIGREQLLTQSCIFLVTPQFEHQNNGMVKNYSPLNKYIQSRYHDPVLTGGLTWIQSGQHLM